MPSCAGSAPTPGSRLLLFTLILNLLPRSRDRAPTELFKKRICEITATDTTGEKLPEAAASPLHHMAPSLANQEHQEGQTPPCAHSAHASPQTHTDPRPRESTPIPTKQPQEFLRAFELVHAPAHRDRSLNISVTERSRGTRQELRQAAEGELCVDMVGCNTFMAGWG